MELVIITGLSGAGKSRAANICEDLNYYVVNNLPVDLLPPFVQLCGAAKGRYERAALVMDVRSLSRQEELTEWIASLSRAEGTVRVLYLEAEYSAILRRYKESRRRHPLAAEGESIRSALEREAELLAPLRERADMVVDTTGMSLNRLRARIQELLEAKEEAFTVNLVSFGYKFGIPSEADLVLDVRCLPNPYYVDELRNRTGLESPVVEYVYRDGTARELTDRLLSLLGFLIPLYEKDRPELTVAVGCTGGRHRSVAVACALAEGLAGGGLRLNVIHRELENQ